MRKKHGRICPTCGGSGQVPHPEHLGRTGTCICGGSGVRELTDDEWLHRRQLEDERDFYEPAALKEEGK